MEYDCVLLDLIMPGMDGVETARIIKEDMGLQVPVIFVTTLNDAQTVARCKEVGAMGYIVRPYQPAFIKSELKRIITGRGDAE